MRLPERYVRRGLTSERAQQFCEEYLIDLDAASAAQRVGLVPSLGYALISEPSINARIKHLMARRATRTQVSADYVFTTWATVATADVNEILQVRRVNCRYCHGSDHRYQWTPAEYARAVEKHEREERAAVNADREPPPAPDPVGGLDFDLWKAPHPDCPECGGEGVARQYVCDTRNLSPAARLLYAGAEPTKDGGVKLKLRDQEAALLNVAKHLGMHVNRTEVSGPNGEALEVVIKVVKPSVTIDADVTELV